MLIQHKVALEQRLRTRLYQTLQGNALFLNLAAAELESHESVTPEEIIRRLADDPEGIFSLSLGRLKRLPIWTSVIKPLLGLLFRSREPLSRSQLKQLLAIDSDQLAEGIEALGGLVVNVGQQRYALFHLKFQEYLRRDASPSEEHLSHKHALFDAEDEREYHTRILTWCEQGCLPTSTGTVNLALIWEESSNANERIRRTYAQQHYITHLYLAGRWQQLLAILDKGDFGRAKIQYDPSMHAYAQDLALGRQAAARPELTLREGLALLPQLWR